MSATVAVTESEWDLYFIELRVIGLHRQYCWDILLSQYMLRVLKCIADDDVVFQQDSAPAHHCVQRSPTGAVQYCQLHFFLSYHPTNSRVLNSTDNEI